MNSLIQPILSKIIRKYSQNSQTLGIVLFGSWARGTADKYSDIDIYIATKSKPRFGRESNVINSARIDVIINSLTEAKKYLENDAYSVRRNTSHMLGHGIILYSQGNELNNIVAQAKKNLLNKTKYTRDEILMHLYSIDDFFSEVQRYETNTDPIAFELHCQLLLNNIHELFLKLHGDFFRRPNEMYAVLARHDRSFARVFRKYCNAHTRKQKLNTLNIMVRNVTKKAGGVLPNNWSVR